MHAVVVRVTINDEQAATERLRSEVVPRISEAPGFVAGYWTRKEREGLSMVIFESEEHARQASELVPEMVFEHVTLDDVDVREVVASA